MSVPELLNTRYIAACRGDDADPPPDCGHDECGLLCDENVLAERLRSRQLRDEGFSLTLAHVRAEGLLREGRRDFSEVARLTGVHRQTVARMARRLGVTPDRTAPRHVSAPKYGAEVVARIADLHAHGLTVRAIAAELGVPKSVVGRRIAASAVPHSAAATG